MLRLLEFSPAYTESLIKCFTLVFDKTEEPYFKTITDYSYTYIGVDNDNAVKAFIIAHKTLGKVAEYEIAYLGVDPSYRRRGYARILLQLIMNRLKGHCLWLNALANNHNACSLYKEFGFKEKERFIDNSGNNAIIFATVECLS